MNKSNEQKNVKNMKRKNISVHDFKSNQKIAEIAPTRDEWREIINKSKDGVFPAELIKDHIRFEPERLLCFGRKHF